MVVLVTMITLAHRPFCETLSINTWFKIDAEEAHTEGGNVEVGHAFVSIALYVYYVGFKIHIINPTHTIKAPQIV